MRLFLSRFAPVLVLAGLACNVYAVDGVILIDQNRALAGGVTPGDTPGFPVTISQPGSYRLDGNLTVPNANTTAILIRADNVTIDLNGFSILGPTVCIGSPTTTSCSPAGLGRGVDSSASNSLVKNGSISGMGESGVYLNLTTAGGYVVIDVRVSSNGGPGIVVLNGIVRGSTVVSNGGTGIFVINSTAIGNLVSGNKGDGISVVCPATAVDNTSFSNGGSNLLTANSGCAVANNSAP